MTPNGQSDPSLDKAAIREPPDAIMRRATRATSERTMTPNGQSDPSLDKAAIREPPN